MRGHARLANTAATLGGLVLLAACGAGIETGGSGNGGSEPWLPSNPRSIPLSFNVHNESATQRSEVIRASVPFPQGGFPEVDDVIVSGHQTAWLVLQRWPDHSVRIAQAQFFDTLPPNSVTTYNVVHPFAARTGGFAAHPWVDRMRGGLQIGAEVQDTFLTSYVSLVNGPGDVVQVTPFVRTTRHRTYHQPFSGPGIGRDFMTSTFYVTEFHDMPLVYVDWVVGNDYLGADNVAPGNTDPNMRPLGVMDVMNAAFLVAGATSALPYRPAQEAIAAPTSTAGFQRFQVMQNTWLEDGQTRRYRFLLSFEDPTAPPTELQAWRATQIAMLEQPIYPLANLRTWQDTAAAGLLGGPLDGPADAATRAAGEYATWAGTNWFGTWGSHGEVVKTGTTGTPRNTPLSTDLAHAIQGDYPRLLQRLEQLAWVQAMRPYHMTGLQVGDLDPVMLWDGVPTFPGSRNLSPESFGRRALWANDPYPGYRTLWAGNERAHGWDPYDEEHWSSDSLFDYYSISGDAWALDELRMIGQCLKGLMRLRNAFTANIQSARAEGWTMHGFVQAYVATGDAQFKDYAMRRAAEVVDVQRRKTHPSRVLCVQPPHLQTGYPTPNTFFMPWQHGAVLYGYLEAFRHFGDPLAMRIAEDVVATVEYSWVHDFNDVYLGHIQDGLRYYVPFSYNNIEVPPSYFDQPPTRAHFGDSPLGGAHTFLISGLHTLGVWSQSQQTRDKAAHYGRLLWQVDTPSNRWDKWHYCSPSAGVP